MAVAFKGVSSLSVSDDNTGTAKSTSFSANVEGDFLVAIIAVSNAGAAVSVDMLDEAGWTRMPANTWLSATAGGTHVYYRFAPAGGITSQTFTAAATTGHVGRGAVYTGVDPANPIDSGPFYLNHTSGTSTSVTAPPYQTTVADSMGILIMNRDASPVVVTGPAGYTVDADTGSANPGDGVMIHLSHQLHASVATHTPGPHTWAATQEAIAMSFALRADTGGGGPVGTYTEELDALGFQHRYSFDGNYNDSIGSVNGTNTGTIVTGSAIAEDATNCMISNGVGDRVALATTADINNSVQTRKVITGWLMLTDIQGPPKSIYREGSTGNYFQLVVWAGNNFMFEVSNTGADNVQAFGDTVLVPNRIYNIIMEFEGTGFGDIVAVWLDGIKQSTTEPIGGAFGAASLNARGVAEFGDASGSTEVGQGAVLLNAPVNGHYQHWAIGQNISISNTAKREIVFEKGALPSFTIASGTQAAMQTALDAIADTVRGNEPLNIRVEAVTGDGDLSLTADNITHDALASIHVQYMGTGALTWTNNNGSNASISSTPNGGSIVFVQSIVLKFTALDKDTELPIQNANILLVDGAETILTGLTNALGVVEITNYPYSSDVNAAGWLRKGDISDPYKEAVISETITVAGLDVTILMAED